MTHNLKIIAQDERHTRASWRNVFLMVYRHSPTLPAVEEIDKELTALVQANPGGIILCSIIEPGCTLPEGPVRDRMKAVMSGLGKGLLGTVTVPEGDGVWAATMRSLMVGVSLVLPSAHVQQICRTQDETAASLAKIMGNNTSPTDVAAVLTQLRAAFPRAAPATKKGWFGSKAAS